MVAITFAVFSAACTFLAVMSAVYFGVSVSSIVNLYFIYLTLTAVVVVAVPVAKFQFRLFQKWAESLRRVAEATLPCAKSPKVARPPS